MQSDFSALRVQRGPHPDEKSGKHVPTLVRQMYDLILIDEPLPTAQLSRYLTTICLVGIERSSTTPDRRGWVNTLNTVLKTAHAMQEQKDTDRSGRKAVVMKNIFEAASRRLEAQKLIEEADGPATGTESQG